ncbi:MAG: hypothetical protein WB822_20435 [Rhodoplanes sp.]
MQSIKLGDHGFLGQVSFDFSGRDDGRVTTADRRWFPGARAVRAAIFFLNAGRQRTSFGHDRTGSLTLLVHPQLAGGWMILHTALCDATSRSEFSNRIGARMIDTDNYKTLYFNNMCNLPERIKSPSRRSLASIKIRGAAHARLICA